MEVSAKFNEMMENETNDGGNHQSEEISQSFICCVCRDLLYKPVVLACGHISCFWCVENSMSGLHKSCCPICRNQYYHLPSVCQTIHLLLLKMYPLTYKTRELQTLEDEEEMGYSSLQFDGLAYQLETEEETIIQPTEDTNIKDKIHSSGTCRRVSISDLLCGSCNGMLCRPSVLNCGHVFCSSCIVLRKSETLKCNVCRSLHPGAVPKVCLEFDHFLEEEFPKEYRLRKDTVQMTPTSCSLEDLKESFDISCSSGDDPSLWWNSDSKVHVGVGCDSCGMYPIIGDRYRCKDCVEEIGYDLCNDCHRNGRNLRGRFNQQHSAQHEFEFMELSDLKKTMLKLLMQEMQDMSGVSDALSSDEFEDESLNIVPLVPNALDDYAENVFETDGNQS